MAQSGYTPIQLYRTTTAGLAPSAGNLSAGELALNTTDVALYTLNASSAVKRVMNNPAGLKYPTADGTSNQVIVTDGSGTLSFTDVSGGLSYVVKTSNYTTKDKEGVLANTTGGAFTVTLPATPATGAQVVVADSAGTWGTNNLTIGRNGSTIAGVAADLVCDISGVSVQLVYNGSTWDVYAQVGGNGGTAVTLDGVQTLTNKTISGSSNTITNISLSTAVTGTLPVANGGTGSTSLTANNVLLGNGTSALQVVAPGTSGNVLTSNGTTWASTAPSAAGFTLGTPLATTSGTSKEYTALPAGVKMVVISYNQVRFSGTAYMSVQLGTSSAYETSAYIQGGFNIYNTAINSYTASTEFVTAYLPGGPYASGNVILSLLDATNNIWALSGNVYNSGSTYMTLSAGRVILSGALYKIKFFDGAGGNSFNGGSLNIMYI